MHTFKVGEKVKWQGNGKVKYGNIDSRFPTYAIVVTGDGERWNIVYPLLYPAEGFYPMPGDTVNDSTGQDRKVIDVCGDVFFTQGAGVTPWLLDRLACEQCGWTILGQTKKVMMTVEEIEQKLGLEKGSLEVKS